MLQVFKYSEIKTEWKLLLRIHSSVPCKCVATTGTRIRDLLTWSQTRWPPGKPGRLAWKLIFMGLCFRACRMRMRWTRLWCSPYSISTGSQSTIRSVRWRFRCVRWIWRRRSKSGECSSPSREKVVRYASQSSHCATQFWVPISMSFTDAPDPSPPLPPEKGNGNASCNKLQKKP